MLRHVSGAHVCITNAGASGVGAGTRTTKREPPRCLLLRQAPRGRRQGWEHTWVGGSAQTTSQDDVTRSWCCSQSPTPARLVSASVVATLREPLVPAFEEGPRLDPRRPEGFGGGCNNEHSQPPPRGGRGPTTMSRRPDTCVVLMQTTNAGTLGVGAGTRLPLRAGDSGGCKHQPPVFVGAPLTRTWGGGWGRRACQCSPTVMGQ